MAKKNTNITRVEFEELQNTVATLAQSVNALSVQIATLASLQAPAQESEAPRKKQSKSKSNSTAVDKKSTNAKAPKSEALSTNLKDYEPVAQGDNYSWASYKAKRSNYCYAVVTKGRAKSASDAFKKGIEVDYGTAWQNAKKAFEKKYKYITIDNR